MIDAIFSDTLVGIINELNKLKVKKESVVTVFQNKDGKYVAVFYV